MGLGFDGESEMKTCPARRVVPSPQAAAIRFNDGAADPKSHTGAVSLGGKEGIEDLVRLLRGQPYAGIADRHQDLLAVRTPRVDGKLARPIHLFYCVDAFQDEVHHDLLQLHSVSHYLGKRLLQLCPY